MSSREWKAVIDIVEKHFPSYIPVPSIGDVESYRILNFVCLFKNKSQSPQKTPEFHYCGGINNMQMARMSSFQPAVLSNKLCVYDDCSRKRSTEATVNTSVTEGDLAGRKKNVSPRLSLGTISGHKVKYEDVYRWLTSNPALNNEIVCLARDKKLFLINDVIMAEKFVISDESEKCEKEVTDAVSKPADGAQGDGCRTTTKSTSSLTRPEDFGKFPIGFKLCKIDLLCKESGGNTNYYLRPEALRYYNVPFERKLI